MAKVEKPEAFGVVWVDLLLGPLTLVKPDADSAIETARKIQAKGADMVRDVRAVHVPAGSDVPIYLDFSAL